MGDIDGSVQGIVVEIVFNVCVFFGKFNYVFVNYGNFFGYSCEFDL